MYLLQCPSKKSKTTIIHFYAVCLLYLLSTATFVSDLVAVVLDVSDDSICKITIFYLMCRRESVHYLLSSKLTHSQCYITFR